MTPPADLELLSRCRAHVDFSVAWAWREEQALKHIADYRERVAKEAVEAFVAHYLSRGIQLPEYPP